MPLDRPAPPEREAWCEPPTGADLAKWHQEARHYINGSDPAGVQAFRVLRLVTALRRERDEKRQAALDYLALEGQMREVVAERERYRAALERIGRHQGNNYCREADDRGGFSGPHINEIVWAALASPTPAAQESKGE